MPSYIYGCGSFQDIRPGILVFWPFGRGYEPRLDITFTVIEFGLSWNPSGIMSDLSAKVSVPNAVKRLLLGRSVS
jgi:hypothetical protein